MKNSLSITLFIFLFSALSPLYAYLIIDRNINITTNTADTLLQIKERKNINSSTEHSVDILTEEENNLRVEFILDFVNPYKKSKSSKAMERLVFRLLQIDFNKIQEDYWAIYYNLILLGNGDDSDKLMLFENKKENLAKNPDDIIALEILAFYYDKGILTEKNPIETKALRLKIDDIINQKNPKDRYDDYIKLAHSFYTSKKKILTHIYDPEMKSFYINKAKAYQLEANIASMSEQDQAFLLEFRDIFRLFVDENGNAIKQNKISPELKTQLGDFYDKVIASESKSIEMMAKYAVIYRGESIGLDSLGFRVLSLPYFLKASDYCPELYHILAYCYNYGRACRGDKKIAADLYLKQALYKKNPDEKRSAFNSAYRLYTELGNYDALKTIIDKREESLGRSISSDISKARFYLMESDYKDPEYARALIEKIKKEAKGQNDYSIIFNSTIPDYLELGELQFWAADKIYKANNKTKWSLVYRVLVSAYMDGIYCEKDLEKASTLLLAYTKNSHEHYDNFIIDSLTQFMLDVENMDETLFRDTLDAMLEAKGNSAPLNLMKAVAIDKGFAYEKDLSQRDLYLEKAANTNTLNLLTTNYSMLCPSDSLLAKLVELSPKNDITPSFNAYIRLKDLENATKYGKLYDANNIEKNYYYEAAAHLILKAESPQAIALRYSKARNRGQGLIYASMQYEGYGIAQDKEKALEGFEKTSELWHRDMGYDAKVWLWKYYTENNQADLAQALIDPKTQGLSLYNAKLLVSTAKNFTDNLDLASVSNTFNLPANEEYAKYFLSLAEDKYLSDYATELLAVYGRNPKLKNLGKKLEIVKKAREILNAPKASKE